MAWWAGVYFKTGSDGRVGTRTEVIEAPDGDRARDHAESLLTLGPRLADHGWVLVGVAGPYEG